MASQDNVNSVMEMGTSDQVLVTPKSSKKTTYIIGGVVMVLVIAVAVTLVVLFTGNNGTSTAGNEALEGTTTAIYTIPTEEPVQTLPTSPSTTVVTTTPTEPTVPAGTGTIELQDIIRGAYSTAGFNATWSSGSELLYRSASNDLLLYDVDTDSTVTLVPNTSTILQQTNRDPRMSNDGNYVILPYNALTVYRYSYLAQFSAINILTNEQIDITPPGVEASQAFLQNFVWGPTGTSCAFVYMNNIYYKDNLTATAQPLTTNGEADVIYNGIPDWVYEEEIFMSNNAMWFSPSGDKFAYATFDDTNVHVMSIPHYGVPGSRDYQYTQHHGIRYPKPGTTNPGVSVHLVDVSTGTSTAYSEPTSLEQPILKSVTFVSNTTIALNWRNRVQNSFIVQLCTEGNTVCNEIFSYTESDGWIDDSPMIFNEAGDAFIIILPQSVSGVLYKQIVQISNTGDATWTVTSRTNTANTVLDILSWTSDDVIWYKATSPEDSAEQHIYSVTSNNVVNCFTCAVTRNDGNQCLYNDAVLNENSDRITISCEGPGVPYTYIYNANGQLIKTWDTSETVSELIATQALPEVIRMQVPIDGIEAEVQIQVPSDYQTRTDVPLLVNVYAGPGTAAVTKQWSVNWGSSLVSRYGIAVAQIDGRGSGLKGVSGEFAVNRQLGTVEIEDQINVTRYLLEHLPWLDSNRTCIWGWSYGGYAASLALVRGGEVFRCAMAVAPVTDWRFYDTMYTERYMDVPANNTVGYAQSSLLTQSVISALRNKSYFLVHATADDNVHYQHSMLLSRLLQVNNVLFDQMTYTDENHSLGGVRSHLYNTMERFMEEHML